jgi:Spy/CpxP family protein refolding chaperone
MKKYLKNIAVLCLLLMSANFVMAQEARVKKVLTAEERAGKQAERWQTQLSLTDEQTANVKALFTERDKKVMELRKNSGTDKEAMKKGGKEIRENTEAALLKIFTPEQKDKYTKIREERKEQKIKGRLDKK